MNGCQTCGGYGMHHDPIAHGNGGDEPETSWQEEAVEDMRAKAAARDTFPDQPDLVARLDRAASERGWRFTDAWVYYVGHPEWSP